MLEGVAERHLAVFFLMFPDNSHVSQRRGEVSLLVSPPIYFLSLSGVTGFGAWHWHLRQSYNSKMDPARVVVVETVSVAIATAILLTQTAKLTFPKPWTWIGVHIEHLPDLHYLIRSDKSPGVLIVFLILLLHIWTLRNREVNQLT